MNLKNILILGALLFTTYTEAAWYEASGQAVIHNNNKELARQQATQEALRQALLFAGASVRSVQQMTDGLLQDENLEVRASGEVSRIELISEHYFDDYVEVAIRADIFPQEVQCSAADYKKSIATSKFHFSAIHQASSGGLFGIATPVTERLRDSFLRYGKHSMITSVQPYSFFPRKEEMKAQSMMLSEQVGSQYILTGNIVELSLQYPEKNYVDTVKFWKKKTGHRNIGIHIMLLDGATGETLHDKTYSAETVWQFHSHQMIDNNSAALWNSPFGQAIDGILREVVLEIDEKLACEPAFGRILEIYQNRLSVNFGTNHGVQKGDELSVFQMRQFFSVSGIPHLQYNIHPSKVIVLETSLNNSVLSVADGTPLANIQPNDFVVRR